MEFKNKNLKLIREALSYGMMNSGSESETAEFALLLLDIDKELNKQKFRQGIMCKSCGKQLDEHAIVSTGLCTACFTSNA